MKTTVVLATYNGEKFIAKQLQSIINQSHLPDEILVVDDCSRDKTISIVNNFKLSSIVPITLFKNYKNIGYVRNFEKGVLLAKHDIVLFSDQDDVWHYDKVKKILRVFVDQYVNVVYHDGEIIDDDGVMLGTTIFKTRRKAELTLGLKRPVDEATFNIDIKGCTMAARKDFLLSHPLPSKHVPELWGHDHWWAVHAYAAGSLAVVDECLIKHRIHNLNVSGRVDSDSFINKIKKNIKTAKGQSNDYFHLRYKELLNSIVGIDDKWILDRYHYGQVVKSIEYFVEVNSFRKNFSNMNFLKRLFSIYKLNRSGFYKKYLNGYITFIRDLFF